VELLWDAVDSGAIAAPQGGPATHGSRGDRPLPPDARILTFTLTAVGPDCFPLERPAGDLVVDLGGGTALWRPAGRP
jgi:hypothetical protein